MTVSMRRHLYFWVLPSLAILAMILAYHSGVPILREIIAPSFSREFGLLENLQVVILLAAVWVAVKGYRRASCVSERLGYGLLALAYAVFCLEEINYGEYFWRVATGQPLQMARGEQFNLHNKISTGPIKNAGDLILLFGFVILPLLVSEKSRAWLRFITPPRLIILAVLCSLVLSKLAHYINDLDESGQHVLRKNTAEFREAYTYYIGLLYVWELVYVRRWPGWRGERGSPFHNDPR